MAKKEQIIVRQIRSAINQTNRQRCTLQALGLRRIGHTRTHADTKTIRGMLKKVAHLIAVSLPTESLKK